MFLGLFKSLIFVSYVSSLLMKFIDDFLQPPASFLQTMEEYVRDAPTGQKEKVWKLQEVNSLIDRMFEHNC